MIKLHVCLETAVQAHLNGHLHLRKTIKDVRAARNLTGLILEEAFLFTPVMAHVGFDETFPRKGKSYTRSLSSLLAHARRNGFSVSVLS